MYYDNDKDSFIRDENNKILITSSTSKNPDGRTYLNISERIKDTIKGIVQGRFKAPYRADDDLWLLYDKDTICENNKLEKIYD